MHRPTCRLGLVTATGGHRWLPAADIVTVGTGARRSVQVTVDHPVAAGGIVVRSTAGRTVVGVPTALTAEAGAVSLDGQLQYGVLAPHWVFTGTVGSFGVFRNTAARGWAWTRSPDGRPAPGSSVTAVAPDESGAQRIAVRTRAPTLLVRSTSWTTGWQASVQARAGGGGTAAYGPSRAFAVRQRGVIQEVTLPGPGEYLVTFRYRPAPAVVGLSVSVLAAAGLTVWVALEATGAVRRRRGSGGRTDPAAELSRG